MPKEIGTYYPKHVCCANSKKISCFEELAVSSFQARNCKVNNMDCDTSSLIK